MALTGTFEDISFAELLQLLNVSHKSGRLEVWRGKDRAKIFVVDGDVARAISRRDRGPDVVYRILGWKTGEFSFERGEEPVARDINESTEALILEGMKRFDEWEQVEAAMPKMHVVLRQRAFAVNELYERLTAEAQKVLQLVDARRNIATIVRESGLDATQAVMAVNELLAEGVVEEWTPESELSEVVKTAGRLPEACGVIDLTQSSYFSSKRRLSENHATPAGIGRKHTKESE